MLSMSQWLPFLMASSAHATHQNIYVIDHCLPFKDFVFETENKNSYK